MRTPFTGCLAIVWLLVAMASPARSQEPFDFGGFDLGGLGQQEQGDPVKVEAQFAQATDDRPAVLMVTANIDPGWHVYSLTQPKGGPVATKLRLDESDKYEPIGEWRSFPEPNTRIDNEVWQGLRIEEHAD